MKKKLFGYDPMETDRQIADLQGELQRVKDEWQSEKVNICKSNEILKQKNEDLELLLTKTKKQLADELQKSDKDASELKRLKLEIADMQIEYEKKEALLTKGMLSLQEEKERVLQEAAENAEQIRRRAEKEAEARETKWREKLQEYEQIEMTIRKELKNYAGRAGSIFNMVCQDLKSVEVEISELQKKLKPYQETSTDTAKPEEKAQKKDKTGAIQTGMSDRGTA